VAISSPAMRASRMNGSLYACVPGRQYRAPATADQRWFTNLALSRRLDSFSVTPGSPPGLRTKRPCERPNVISKLPTGDFLLSAQLGVSVAVLQIWSRSTSLLTSVEWFLPSQPGNSTTLQLSARTARLFLPRYAWPRSCNCAATHDCASSSRGGRSALL